MTLVEVMIALVIIVVMAAVIMQSMQSAVEFHRLLAARDETVRTARAALAKLGHDLQLAYLTPNRNAVNRYQTLFVGDYRDPAQLFFASLGHQRLYLDSRECDQTEITVWGERAPAEMGKGYVLYHREAPRIDEYPDEQGRIWPLAYNVREFRLRYLDQISQEWKNEWDSRSGDTPYRLPRAVEIGLVLIAPDLEDPTGEETVDVPFLSTVIVEYAARLPGPNNPFNAGLGTGGAADGTTPAPTFGGGGGYGESGSQGLSGGQLGGMLGLMGGGRGAGGRSPSRAPSSAGAGGALGSGVPPGGVGGVGGPGGLGGPR